jgi:hypothetical protein
LVANFLVAFFLAEGLLTVYRVVKHGKVGREEVIRVRSELRDDFVGGIGDRDENRQVLHPFLVIHITRKIKVLTTLAFGRSTIFLWKNLGIQSQIVRGVNV